MIILIYQPISFDFLSFLAIFALFSAAENHFSNRKGATASDAEALSIRILVGVNADLLLSLALVLKLHCAINEGKQSIVLTNANILTCAYGTTALSDDNVACQNVLTVTLLGA